MSIINTANYAARAVVGTSPLTRRRMSELSKNERLSPDALHHLQSRYLHATLQLAVRKFPFYKEISPNFGLGDVTRVLRDFPVIDKTTLLANASLLYPHGGRALPWDLAGKTSGTTGTPLTTYRSFESTVMEQAFIRRHWEWADFPQGSTRVTLRGDMVVPLDQTHPPFWYWNHFERQLVVSSRHLQDQFIGPIIREIRRAKPRALQAYPSTAYLLAQFLAERDDRIEIPYLFSASEPLYDHQVNLITERLGSTIMDMYGMAERVAFATGCEEGSMHINPDYSFVEIVDQRGEPTDGEGFIVGTTFHNRLMPLVRYKLSDRTRFSASACPCGRTFPVIEPVTGKYEDVIYSSTGNPISPSVLTFALKGVHHIVKSQVAEIAHGRWQIRIVPMEGFSREDEAKLVDNIHHLVDPDVSIDVVLKADLPNTKEGKFRWIVNENIGSRPPCY